MNTISNTDNYIDVRDVIENVENDAENCPELVALLEELKGNGGDEQWNGDWYPLGLIHEDHFKDYAQELAEDCGMIVADAIWPNNCIDWDEAADELKVDYTTVEFDGETYYYR